MMSRLRTPAQAALIALEEGRERSRLANERAEAERLLAAIPASEDISDAEITSARNEEEFRRRQERIERRLQEQQQLISQQIPQVISKLPTEQVFRGGGISFIGGTIRENPIDTLSEVIQNFPELSASQAADFLRETQGRILPSQVQAGLIDPDIKNIVAGFVGGGRGQAFPVSSTPLETLSIKKSEAQEAAEFTCKQFGLNCELVDSMMA